MKKILAVLASALYLSSWGALAQQVALNDGQILEVLTQANNVDIASGKLARTKAANADVKGFAERMIAEHQQSNDEGKAVSKRIKTSPQGSAVSGTLESAGKDAMKSMKNLKGADFDQAYIKNEILVHQKVLDTIDKNLLPNAKNAEVTALLNKTRPIIASHLEHAEKLQAALLKTGS